MDNNKTNFVALYVVLGACATILIFSGIFLPTFLEMIQVNLNPLLIKILQIAFIASGVVDFGLLIYAYKKLN